MRRTMVAMALLPALWVGAPAAAIEPLTGLYDAKANCKGIQAGSRGKQKLELEIAVSDLGGGQVLIDVPGLGDFDGFVITDLAKPEGGVLSAITCPLAALNQDGSVLQLDVKTKTGGDSASLKGTLVILDEAEAQSAVCKFSAKRTSTTVQKLTECTPG
jgi:hypothetical protein